VSIPLLTRTHVSKRTRQGAAEKQRDHQAHADGPHGAPKEHRHHTVAGEHGRLALRRLMSQLGGRSLAKDPLHLVDLALAQPDS